MNTLKRLAIVCLSVCFIVPCVVFTSHAADGTIWFSDPSTSVGENVEVDLVVKGNGEAIGDTDIVLNYDPAYLEFISGGIDIRNEGNGKLHYTGKGTGSEAELSTTLVFRALQTGSPQVTVESSSGYLFSDEGLYFQEGNSTISIRAAADGTTSVPGGQSAMLTGETVTIGDVTYTLAEDFIPVTIPQGFFETMVTYNGADRRFVANENGVTLGYLKDASGAGAFFIYNAENATFAPYIVVGISETTSIALLDGTNEVSVPEGYQQAALTVSDYQLTAWQDMQHEGYYLLYAMNVYTGAKQLYSYDTAEGTYQRFIMPQVANTDNAEDDTQKDDTKNLLPFLMGGGAGLLVMLIVIIVLAVKLLHRNQELDDIYEEYGITDEEEPAPKKEKKDKKPSGKERSKKESYEYDEDDEYEDDGYDEYEDDEYAEYDDEYDEEYEDDGYDDYDDDFEEEEYEAPSRPTSRGKKGSASTKGKKGYDLEFIDL